MQCFPMFSTDESNLEQSIPTASCLRFHAQHLNEEQDSFRRTIIQQYDEIPKFRTSTDLSTNNRIAKLQLVEGYAVGARNFFIRLYNGTTEGSMFCFNFQ